MVFFVILPPRLSQAANELAAGQTTAMDAVLWAFCVLWLFVVVEDASISLTSRELLTFPFGSAHCSASGFSRSFVRPWRC